MKKKILNLLLLFSISLGINITSVYANTCSYQDSCNGLNKYGYYCVSHAGVCEEATCAEIGNVAYQQCDGARDKSGEECVFYNNKCMKKSEASPKISCSQKDSNSCNGFDDYNHYCVYHAVSGYASCDAVSCAEIGNVAIQQCNNAIDYNGEACVVYNNKCMKKSEANIADYDGNDKKDTTIDGYDNYESDGDVVCGKGWVFNRSIANVTHYMVLLFQIIAPVMLIILGMIDLMKGIVAGKDDEIKKGQSAFIKRLIIALLLFFVITIVRIVLNLLSNGAIIDCFDCFVNGAKNCTQSM